jgi:hypothetical protein
VSGPDATVVPSAKTSKNATTAPPASAALEFLAPPALRKARSLRPALERAVEVPVDEEEVVPPLRAPLVDPFEGADPFVVEEAARQSKWQFLARSLRKYKWWEIPHFENPYHTGASRLVSAAVAESHPFVPEALDRTRNGPAPNLSLLAKVKDLDRRLAEALIQLGDAYQGRCSHDPDNPPAPVPWLHDGLGEIPPGDKFGNHYGALCTFPRLDFCEHTPAHGDAYVILTAGDHQVFVERFTGDDVVDYNSEMTNEPWARFASRAASDAYRRAHSPSPPMNVPPVRVLVPASVPTKVLQSPLIPAGSGSKLSAGAGQVVRSGTRVAVEMAPLQPDFDFVASRVTIMIQEALSSLEAGGEHLGKNGLLGSKDTPRTADGVVVCPVHPLNP